MKTVCKVLFLSTIDLISSQTIDKYVLASGGETITSANNTITITIGEPIIGTVEIGSVISQGFLAGAAAGGTLTIDERLMSATIKVYPNPVVDILSINLDTFEGQAEARVYNNIGQLVKTVMLNTPNIKMNLNYLQSGIYLFNLHFSEHNRIKSFKIIKK